MEIMLLGICRFFAWLILLKEDGVFFNFNPQPFVPPLLVSVNNREVRVTKGDRGAPAIDPANEMIFPIIRKVLFRLPTKLDWFDPSFTKCPP